MIHVIVTTFRDADQAAEVVRKMVEERLAACGTILPAARSIYFWNEVVEENSEAVVVFKTSHPDALKTRLEAIHPYETPEILIFPTAGANASYSAWVESVCGKSPGRASR